MRPGKRANINSNNRSSPPAPRDAHRHSWAMQSPDRASCGQIGSCMMFWLTSIRMFWLMCIRSATYALVEALILVLVLIEQQAEEVCRVLEINQATVNRICATAIYRTFERRVGRHEDTHVDHFDRGC
mmetsp:Transcript_27798/g.44214  ORF Transcript_27798/g.44214 Transcript_27798/m.44214 type:complete len:128 (-) Transcript_27798:820-1203(-)